MRTQMPKVSSWYRGNNQQKSHTFSQDISYLNWQSNVDCHGTTVNQLK